MSRMIRTKGERLAARHWSCAELVKFGAATECFDQIAVHRGFPDHFIDDFMIGGLKFGDVMTTDVDHRKFTMAPIAMRLRFASTVVPVAITNKIEDPLDFYLNSSDLESFLPTTIHLSSTVHDVNETIAKARLFKVCPFIVWDNAIGHPGATVVMRGKWRDLICEFEKTEFERLADFNGRV